jgi:NAD(P)-dependent dehydrogenase (short-subunit alcohol dehydrogenase family)
MRMGKGTLLVVGAAGDVGQGIVEAALASGRSVVAAGRSDGKLNALAARLGSDALACVAGDLGSETGAAALWRQAGKAFGGIDDVVVSVNAPTQVSPLLDWSAEDLSAALSANVLTHFIAAKAFLPHLPETGILIGIGGGTADFIFPKMAHVSMAQAAQRMLYRGLAKERKSGAQLRELMIVSMVAGQSNRDSAPPDWVTDVEVGRHVCAILDAPEKFARPILHLRSREQVGLPEAEG